MNNFNFTAALRQCRLDYGESYPQMGERLNMSRSTYYRLEKGIVKPSYERAKEIMDSLDIDESVWFNPTNPPAPRRWYRSKMLHWFIPIVVSYLVQSWIFESVGFQESFGGEAFQANPPYNIMVIVTVVTCLFYYNFFPPEWPFKKNRE